MRERYVMRDRVKRMKKRRKLMRPAWALPLESWSVKDDHLLALAKSMLAPFPLQALASNKK